MATLLVGLRLMSISSMSTSKGATVKLNSGFDMPMVGIGTAAALNRDSIKTALDAGYRLIDSAQATEWYRESEAGEALQSFFREGKVTRSDVFLTSKLHPRNLGYSSTKAVFESSLTNFHTDYLDLFMLHYPRCWPSLCDNKEPEGTFLDSWRAMEQLVQAGKIRSLGVSNFELTDLRELLAAAKVKPAVVQNWMDPFHQDRHLRAFCKEHDIHYQSYSSLGTQWEYREEGKRIGGNPVQKHPTVHALAAKKGWSNTQLVLTWALQHGVSVVPRSSKAAHIRDNGRVFGEHSGAGAGGALFPEGTLSESEMAEMDALDGTLAQWAAEQAGGGGGGSDSESDAGVAATFHNRNDHPVELYWVDSNSNDNTVLVATLGARAKESLSTHHSHKFVARMQGGAPLALQVQVDRQDGASQTFTIAGDGVHKGHHREL